MKSLRSAGGWLLLASHLVVPSSSFSPRVAVGRSPTRRSSSVQVDGTEVENETVVKSPLRFLGPYPTMPLRFPNLATSSQRERNVTGVSLDWVLDTAANVNTINAQVAMELQLEKVGEAPRGVGAAGGIVGGDTFMLGDCAIDVMKKAQDDADEIEEDSDIFMKELTASALPVASPAAAGLLGLAFFYCFDGGVEFRWGNAEEEPSVTFIGSEEDLDVEGLTRVPFESLPVSMLPSVTLRINGEEIPALFDTGSPITVLNAKAAEAAGIETVISLDTLDSEEGKKGGGGWNPFSKLAANIQSAQEMAKAAQRGDILTIAGTDGKPVRLVRSESSEKVDIKADRGQTAEIGAGQLYIGDIPGLAALGGLGGEAPPAAVLGMDFIRSRPRVVFRARQNEIYM
ncbi:hypothetical protein ACHAXT_004360 [Thalassiosira profunda]